MRLPFHTTVLASALLLTTACSKNNNSTGHTCEANGYHVGDLVDLNGDGKPDGKAVDVTGDCIPDGVDTNGDGAVDAPLPAGPTGGGDGDAGGVHPTPYPDGGSGFIFPDGGGTLLPPTSSRWVADHTDMGGLDTATITALKAGGSNCSLQIVYPYKGTGFPGGLLPPTIMWTGGGDAAYVKMAYDSVNTLDYQYAAPSPKGELTIPVQDWYEVTRRSQGSQLNVTLNVRNGGTVSSCQTNWTIARGNMVGAVYYNTYNHPDTANVGGVIRLTLGQPAAQLYLYDQNPISAAPSGPCMSCHSVSANGSMMAASDHYYFIDLFGSSKAAFTTSSYKITDAVQPKALSPTGDATFGGMTPDGTRILAMGNPQCTQGANTFPRAPNNFMLINGPVEATLLDTSTGKSVGAKGLNKDWYMWMPQFSPDGKKVVFNHAKPDGQGGTDRRELAVMDFDSATNTFSNLKVIVSNRAQIATSDYLPQPPEGGIAGGISGTCPTGTNDPNNAPLSGNAALAYIKGGSCSGPCYPAWPFFTPDGNGVVYSLISEPDFAVAFPGRDAPSKSELWYVDLTTGGNIPMVNANKALDGESTQINYYPTVLPVQIGGYYWAFWTSTRKYGTRSTDGDPSAVLAAQAIFGDSAKNSWKKRLWVAAIKPRLTSTGEFSMEPLTDPSLPPFYLEGQASKTKSGKVVDTGNVRAFAALNPCKETGSDCTSGLDCCTGYCDIDPTTQKGTCAEEVTCSNIDDKCTKDSDCCVPDAGARLSCLAGTCGYFVQ